MDRGTCASGGPFDPDIWFVEKDDPEFKHKEKWAKRICAACPVMKTCLDYAIEHDIQDGIWGKMTPRERRAYVKENGLTSDPESARPIDLTNKTRGFVSKKSRGINV